MKASEIIRWLQSLGTDTVVYIGEGGLALECEEGAYLEVGGQPTTEEDGK